MRKPEPVVEPVPVPKLYEQDISTILAVEDHVIPEPVMPEPIVPEDDEEDDVGYVFQNLGFTEAFSFDTCYQN